MSTPTLDPHAQDVLDFWFGAAGSATEGRRRDEWFRKDDGFDHEIADRFLPWIERALRGELSAWATRPDGALASILLLDQFTRNAFRDTPRAFAGDPQALALASAAVGSGQDLALSVVQRAFIYLPFEHAEGMAMQDEAVRLMKRLALEDPGSDDLLAYAKKHRDVIFRFGRFPHRNDILGRRSTVEEMSFLAQPGSRF